MKYIGFWLNEYNKDLVKQYKDLGFNAIFLPLYIVDGSLSKYYSLINYCLELGYEKILLDYGWRNYNKELDDIFKSNPNIIGYIDEPYECWVETNEVTLQHLIEYEKNFYKVLTSVTARNHDKYPAKVLSSYYNSWDYFNNKAFVWVFGNFDWHIFNSLRYKKIKQEMIKHGIDWVMFYQADNDKIPFKKVYQKYLLQRFLSIFGAK